MSGLRLVVFCCLAGVALLVAGPAGAQAPLPGEMIAAGVSAADTNLAGLTIEEAAAKLESVHRERLENGIITVQAADITWTFKTLDADVDLDALTSAKRALYAGRNGGGAPVSVPLEVTYAKAPVDAFAATIAKRLARPARDAKLKISLQKVRVTSSKRGRSISERLLIRQLRAAITDPQINRVIKPKLLAPSPKVTADKLRKGASTVLTISQKTFKLRLFKNLKVVKTYKVAVGQPQYPTPRGLFSIANKQVDPVWSVPNSPWAGELAGTTVTGGSAANPLKARWMGIVDGVGIHGTGEDASIGSRASHGCIRMHVSDVIALYKRVPVGTPVLIG